MAIEISYRHYLPYTPSRQEIKQKCKEIRKGWDLLTERRRREGLTDPLPRSFYEEEESEP